MTNVQLEQMSALVNTLRLLQQRMSRTKNMFPSHHEELERRYNQLLAEAKQNKITPPWMAA
jgi:hypothetical protein